MMVIVGVRASTRKYTSRYDCSVVETVKFIYGVIITTLILSKIITIKVKLTEHYQVGEISPV